MSELPEADKLLPRADPPPAANPEAAAKKRAFAEQTLAEVLRLLPAEAKTDWKDSADGGLSVAITPSGEFPGMTAGKRSPVVESLQFLLNKIVNKPGEERRWVAVGIGAHPEPRGPKGPRPGQTPATIPAQAGQQVSSPPPPGPGAAPAPRREAQAPRAPARGSEAEERSLEVQADPALSTAVAELARKSASLGRFYAIAAMKPDDRARVLQSVQGIAGLKVHVEGEGRNRRVVFTPDKPVALPKRTIPDYGEDEE